MATRTVSELANWDGRLDQQRQNAKWRRPSSTLTRDPIHTPQPIEIFQSPGMSSDQKRAEKSTFRPNLERDSLTNSPTNARLPSRIDTTSTSLHDINHYHQASIAANLPLFPCVLSSSRFSQHAAPNPALPSSPFTASQKSSHFTPSSSVHASRVYNPPPSSRERVVLSQTASTIESDVIDLTMEDTEDELPVSDMLVSKSTHSSDQCADPGPSHRCLSSRRSSPIAPEQSLFTPPPTRRRARRFMDYLAVPLFPEGLTKADYQPMSDRSTVPLTSPTVSSTLRDASLAQSSVTKECTPPQKRKGKEREHDMVSSRKEYSRRSPANGADVDPSTSLDVFSEHAVIPLQDVDTYPPLTTFDLAINSRFQFAHAWRGHASRLREAELDWMFKFKLPCTWAQSVDTSSPRVPGTVGYVVSERLRSWELALPERSPEEKSTKLVMDEQADATNSDAVVEVAANSLSSPDDAPPAPSATFDSVLSNSMDSQGLTVADAEHDMNQYFNGLSDSPTKYILPRQQLAPTHTFRPHILPSTGHTQIDSLGLGFPPLGLDPRLADTGDHECFLVVPPSPTPADMEPPSAPGPIPDSPFEPVNYFPVSPGDIFGVSPTDAWSFEHGEGLQPDNDSLPSSHVTPTALGTIDPSLLGLEESQTPSQAPKDTSLKRRSKLPEPVIYIRRPIDSSRLPVVSGKRPVQIKYRDSGSSPATPSPQTGSNEAPSNVVENPVAPSTNDREDSLRTKRHSAPSRKLREYHPASESDSDYIPETSAPKIKPKLKRPSIKLRDEELDAEQRSTGAETILTFCHQCRNKSARPKMLCSNTIQGRVCGKRFCNRCILYRYPDITFDEHSAGFLCPACTNTCNCSVCSRNRGEEFISMRLGGLAASLFKTKVTLVRDVSKPLHRARSPKPTDARRSASAVTTPTPEPDTLPTPSQFWAHVYGMEGDRMGSAFMTRDTMERLQAGGQVVAPPPPKTRPPKKAQKVKPATRDEERDKARRPHVFVGRPLPSWKVRGVRDLEPSVDAETRNKEAGRLEGTGKEREKEKENTRRRCFIGNPAPLHEPYGRMPGTARRTPPSSRCSSPVLNSDGSLTPLSGLDVEAEYWPQPEVGECCSWAPPPDVITHGLPSTFVGEPPDSGSPGIVGTGTGSGSGSGAEVGMHTGDEPGSASTVTMLSQEDLARAISAALATLS